MCILATPAATPRARASACSAGNPMNHEAVMAITEARDHVLAAWRASPEGRAALEEARKQSTVNRRDEGNRGQGILASLLQGVL